MKYNAPYGESDPNAAYQNGNPTTGTMGSIPPAESIEYPQREIVDVITYANTHGLIDYNGAACQPPANTDLQQLTKAIYGLSRSSSADGVQNIPGASHTFVAGDGGNKLVLRANGGGWMHDILPGTGAFLPKGWQATIMNGDIGSTGLYNIKPAAGALLNGSSGGFLWLGPGQELRLFSDGAGNYWTTVLPGRIRFGNNVAWNVSISSGNNATGDGSPTAPWADPAFAVGFLMRNCDLNAYITSIKMGDGTYVVPNGIQLNAPLVGQQSGSGGLSFIGNTAAPGNCIIEGGTTGDNFNATGGAAFAVTGFQLHAATNGVALLGATCGGRIDFSKCNFGPVTNNSEHIAAEFGGLISGNDSYAIFGGGLNHVTAANGGTVVLSTGITVTLSGTPNFTGGFAAATSCGTVVISGVIFTGSGAIGPSYGVALNGVVQTNGGGPAYLPGNAAGGVNTGGQYT